MNIKNAEAERLTRELAKLTGESLTTAARWRDDLRTSDHGDLLYDERGLPR